MSRLIWLMLTMTCTAWAQTTLEVQPSIVTREDALKATLKLPSAVRGTAKLRLRWTDSYGRTVADEIREVRVDGSLVPFSMPLKRAVALQNILEAELVAGDSSLKTAKAEFIVTPPAGWDDYQVIMYYPYRSEQQQGLRDLGVTAGQIQNISSRTPDGAAIWWRNDFRFYCDQMAYDFYAPYHTPALRDKEQRMKEAKILYKSDRSRKDAFFRQPCLNDLNAEAKALARISQVVSAQKRFRPFFYSTDETGVANLVEAWDFCFCPLTLRAMRKWLVEQYGSLEAINREWGTAFASLEEVTPLTTDEMMKRGDDNLSPWADHRTFMNVTFAQEARRASDTVRSIDPTAIAGLVGCQMPSAFGGYDYWLLSQSIDVAEPYNIGNNREIWRSFAPGKPALTTGFGADDHEVWRLWYQALHGDKGVIIYDEQNRYLDSTGKPTALGRLVAPTYLELTGGIGKQLSHMERVNDPIAIHYSHPSITAHWMIEHRPLGEAWVDKGSPYERQQSDFLRLRHSTLYLLEDNLRQYYFVSYAQLENGSFDKMPTKVMLLPQSVAMSKDECAALRRFVDRGGWLIADCRTALMDSHCKTQAKGQLDDLFGIERSNLKYAPGPVGLSYRGAPKESQLPARLERISAAEPGVNVSRGAVALYRDAKGTPAVIVKDHGKGRTVYLNMAITDYHRWRLQPPEGESLRQFVAAWLEKAGVSRQYKIVQSNGQPVSGVEIHPWRSGDLRILGIQRNYGMNVSELGPARYQKQDALEAPIELKVDFGKTVALYDTRRGEFLGNRKDYTFSLHKTLPSVFTILPQPVTGLTISAPPSVRPGEIAEIGLQVQGLGSGDTCALRVSLLDPAGMEVRMLTGNLAASGGKATWEVPLAVDSPKGRYTLVARDIATGARAQRQILVQ